MLGDIATWATAAIAAAGLFGAWKAYTVSRQMRIDEIERDKKRQAVAVSSWMTFLYDLDEDGTEVPRGNAIVVRNDSDSAIYDLQIAAVTKGKVGKPFRAGVCPPGLYYSTWDGYDRTTQFEWQLLSDRESCPHKMRPYTLARSWSVSTIQFTDGAGIEWVRENGRLASVQQPSAAGASDLGDLDLLVGQRRQR